MRNESFRHYAMGTVQLGIGMGIIAVLTRWVSQNLLVTSPEVLVKYGLIGGIGFSLALGIALVLFALLGKRIRRELPEGQTIADYLRGKLHPAGYRVMLGFILATSVNAIFVHGLAAGYFLQKLTGLSLSQGVFLFFLLCLLYAGFGGGAMLNRVGLAQMVFLFMTLILLPVNFFVREGVEQVYDGIRLYHPYLLVWNNRDGWYLILAGVIVGVGQVLSDRSLWQRLFMMEEKKVVSILGLSGFIWSTLPPAVATLTLFAIHKGSFANVYSLLYALIDTISTPALLGVFILGMFSMVTASFGAELHALVCLFVRNMYQAWKPAASDRELLRAGYLFAAAVSLLSFLLTVSFAPSLLQLLLFAGVIQVALMLPMLVVIFSRRPTGNLVPYSTVIAAASGYGTWWIKGGVGGIFVAFLVSLLLIALSLFLRK
ncbi:transporter [Brevibacillus sp. SYP-B805]|uniref:transporter n=1 Tax=Brevibacillus sp. SYP-B805 TaxID=1578199 RepID=UPI0013E9F3DE|nr:transporter [Brevibacillus sp. SYP-B805]NGQ97142.1 transporter [Brevibacillus sp. SYP-B805]